MSASRAAAGRLSRARGVLLAETVRRTGVDRAVPTTLAPWRRPRAVHNPGKIMLDVALALALRGDCLADVGMLRPSRPCSVWRLPNRRSPASSTSSLRRDRGPWPRSAPHGAHVRKHAWKLASQAAPDADGSVIVDIDGVLVLAHSEKQDAAATWKRPAAARQRGTTSLPPNSLRPSC
ncbi:transposase [Streptomyces formicae]